ncbi:MAG TPA: DUF58 domain-containing protein [Bacteroidales bacterium]|nr:DUF58 domain-containing protein [Bacteroidales bacterium]HRZ48759.1 DUF58 domain-containing protein [Bacteroidales bacterium]
MKNLYLAKRLYLLLGIVAGVFAAGFFYEPVRWIAMAQLAVVLGLLAADIVTLFIRTNPFIVRRKTTPVWSLADENPVSVSVENRTSRYQYKIRVLDELPEQLQKRDLVFTTTILPGKTVLLHYTTRPVTRGEYHYGRVIVLASTRLGLAARRFTCELNMMVPVYPSVIQMKKFEIRSMEKLSRFYGVKKMRKIGHSYEFDTIKNYVTGDDMRCVNWKATSRSPQLMVNHYEDEKSQQIYSVIDKSRPMMLPCGGVTLMDHAINTSLVMSNVALQKHDKAGLVTFSDRMGSVVRAGDRREQMSRIFETLYHEKPRPMEADFGLLYQVLQKLIPVRSMVFLYTNFESRYALERVLPVLRKISHRHLLLVINFEHEGLNETAIRSAGSAEEVYVSALAREMAEEKQQMAILMRHHGIQVILTKPEDLTVNSVNRYLELKARGMI